MTNGRMRWMAATALLAFSGFLSAHHSIGVFEITRSIWVKGTVMRYNWSNPHAAIIVEQKLDNGQTTRWAIESSAPIRLLLNRGFTKHSFKIGDVIEACGFAPKSSNTRHLPIAESGNSERSSHWLAGANRVITGRLLLTKDGPRVHWSHYGPLASCINEEQLHEFSHED